MPTRAVVVAGVAASVAEAACTREGSTVAVAAIAAGRIRHIPSQAAPVVPDMDTPVVPVARWPVIPDGTIADMDMVRRRWELQRLMGHTALITIAMMRTAIGSVPIRIDIDTRT